MDLPLKRVEDFLHQKIPLAKVLNCQITESSNRQLSLLVPRFVNTVEDNDFSDLCVVTICQLSAWTFLQVALLRLDYKPLLSLEQVSWKRKRALDPSSNALTATCSQPNDKEWQQFLRMLSRKARGQANLTAILSDELGELAVLNCEYMVRDLDPV